MNERTQDRLFAACGVGSVVLELVGTAIGFAGGKSHSLTITSTPAQIAHALAKPCVSGLMWPYSTCRASSGASRMSERSMAR